jgi:hypothetical protein
MRVKEVNNYCQIPLAKDNVQLQAFATAMMMLLEFN